MLNESSSRSSKLQYSRASSPSSKSSSRCRRPYHSCNHLRPLEPLCAPRRHFNKAALAPDLLIGRITRCSFAALVAVDGGGCCGRRLCRRSGRRGCCYITHGSCRRVRFTLRKSRLAATAMAASRMRPQQSPSLSLVFSVLSKPSLNVPIAFSTSEWLHREPRMSRPLPVVFSDFFGDDFAAHASAGCLLSLLLLD